MKFNTLDKCRTLFLLTNFYSYKLISNPIAFIVSQSSPILVILLEINLYFIPSLITSHLPVFTKCLLSFISILLTSSWSSPDGLCRLFLRSACWPSTFIFEYLLIEQYSVTAIQLPLLFIYFISTLPGVETVAESYIWDSTCRTSKGRETVIVTCKDRQRKSDDELNSIAYHIRTIYHVIRNKIV